MSSGDEISTHAIVRMATQYGQLQEFKPDSDSIKSYLERVSLYFAANDVADGKRVPVLLSSIGASTYAVLSDLLAPAKPAAKILTKSLQPCRTILNLRDHDHRMVSLS